jgi:hypothetical protein
MAYYTSIHLEGLWKTRNFNQNDQSLGRDLNPGPTEYEARVLTTRPRRSVILTCAGVITFDCHVNYIRNVSQTNSMLLYKLCKKNTGIKILTIPYTSHIYTTNVLVEYSKCVYVILI